MDKQIYENFIKALKDEGHISSPKWEKYYRDSYKNVVVLTNGAMVPIEKERTETSFCFGYRLSKHDTEEYDNANKMADHASKSESYFITKNLEGINRIINRLEDDDCDFYIQPKYYNSPADSKIYGYAEVDRWSRRVPEGATMMGKEDRKLMIEGYKAEKTEFEKRLKTYLKRFGTSKLKTWSYWQDA